MKKRRILLLTVAGLSSRFSESLGQPTIKCLYHENDVEESLLHRMLARREFFDEIVVVGGYRFDELEAHIRRHFAGLTGGGAGEACASPGEAGAGPGITLVYNKEFAEYGSGYSFYKGIEAIRDRDWDELVFAEGDLFLDDRSFERVCLCEGSVITYNSEPIEADKSVALYLDAHGVPRYIFDTQHKVLTITEPFRAIYNSGQVWKFSDRQSFDRLVYAMQESDFWDTNLVPVGRYFAGIPAEDISYIKFDTWINCNTVEDYRRACQGGSPGH